MENQGLSEGSLRNSHRETHAVRRKPAPAQFQQLASKLVESCSQDLIIRQRCDIEKSAGALKRGVFYVMENEGRANPGFLVILPGKPPIFLQHRGGRGFVGNTLRLRVNPVLGEGGGTVLVATLDDVLHSLRLEDVWMWRGAPLTGETYTRRRDKLREFVEHFWVPDARLLGGIFTTVANPMSMDEFAKRAEWSCASIEFIPDMPGKRRMVVFLDDGAARSSRPTPIETPAMDVAAAAPPTPAPVTAAPPVLSRKARAVPVEKMPDVYDLFDEARYPISRASVQQFALSQRLRTAVASGEVWVEARWRPEFGGYEIVALK